MAALFQPEAPNQFGAMAGVGHEDPFPPPGLSGRYVIRQKTLAGTRGNGQDAP